jgi:hypothetical protein
MFTEHSLPPRIVVLRDAYWPSRKQVVAILEPIPETANDVGVMTTVSDGRNATDERGSARHFYFFRCLRLTYEVGIGIFIIELSKDRGSL